MARRAAHLLEVPLAAPSTLDLALLLLGNVLLVRHLRAVVALHQLLVDVALTGLEVRFSVALGARARPLRRQQLWRLAAARPSLVDAREPVVVILLPLVQCFGFSLDPCQRVDFCQRQRHGSLDLVLACDELWPGSARLDRPDALFALASRPKVLFWLLAVTVAAVFVEAVLVRVRRLGEGLKHERMLVHTVRGRLMASRRMNRALCALRVFADTHVFFLGAQRAMLLVIVRLVPQDRRLVMSLAFIFRGHEVELTFFVEVVLSRPIQVSDLLSQKGRLLHRRVEELSRVVAVEIIFVAALGVVPRLLHHIVASFVHWWTAAIDELFDVDVGAVGDV